MNRKMEDGIFVIDVGYRNEVPVALIEKHGNDFVEYIIAFNYRVNNNKMTWNYGYYYDRNIDKAMNDFKEVLDGGNLAETFSRKDKNDKSCNIR